MKQNSTEERGFNYTVTTTYPVFDWGDNLTKRS